jgi:hypothetical protein
VPSPELDITDPVSATLQRWAYAQLAPWLPRRLRRMPTERELHSISARAPNLRLFHFAAGAVMMQPSPDGGGRWQERAEAYLRFFGDVARLLPAGFNATICAGVGDKVLVKTLPIFGFQKHPDEPFLLMPDIDFLVAQFHEGPQLRDEAPYAAKAIRAVFAGATTGGLIDADIARNCDMPRLRAARFFQDRIDVDFRLPHVTQCVDAQAQAILQSYPFCQRPRLSWPEQFQSRFLISIDGNGATCSRVAVALASNSVLLKYESNQSLYYFAGLVPHVHYVPVARDEDVLAILDAERAEPGRYAAIAQAARSFAATYLTRARIIEYTARLVMAYAALLHETDATGADRPPRRIVAAARGADGASYHSDQHGWLGMPGSGTRLTSLKLLTQPRGDAPRILYQALLEDGRFTPTAVEGAWCGDDDGQGLTGIWLANARGARKVTVSIDARFIDGSAARVSEMGVLCRSRTGAPLEALRVQVT